jgi:hypothetical protein
VEKNGTKEVRALLKTVQEKKEEVESLRFDWHYQKTIAEETRHRLVDSKREWKRQVKCMKSYLEVLKICKKYQKYQNWNQEMTERYSKKNLYIRALLARRCNYGMRYSKIPKQNSKTKFQNKIPKQNSKTKFQNKIPKQNSKTKFQNKIPKQNFKAKL